MSLDLVQKNPKSETPSSRRHSMNLFVRLRISKQDKIAANVAQHIRAVRAAEDLDRRTRLRRTDSTHFSSIGSSILPVQRSTSSGEDSPGHDKRRLVGMLRQHYEQVNEEDGGQSEDVACQTSYDLLEALLPTLRKRMVRSETMTSTLTPDEEEAKHMYKMDSYHKHPFYIDSYRHHSVCGTNHASINMAYDNVSPMSRGSIGQKSKCRHWGDRIEVEYKMPDHDLEDYDMEEVISLKEMKRTKALQLLGKKSQYNKLQAVLAANSEMALLNLPQEGVSEASFSPTVSQDSLIDATSSIIEESASTGSDDTPGSAVYKNIIINLGGSQERRGLFSTSHSSTNSAANLNLLPKISDSRTSQSQESFHDGSKRNSPEVTKWKPPNGNAQSLQSSKPSGDR